MRLILHYLKRILYYDVPISLIGAFVTQIGHRSGANWLTIASELGIRFLLIACTVGYAFSVLLYVWLRRRELPIYVVKGMHFRIVVVAGFSFLFPISCILGFVAFASIGLIRQ